LYVDNSENFGEAARSVLESYNSQITSILQ